MIITPTSVAFILLSIGLGLCGWYFLSAFKKESQLSENVNSIRDLLGWFLLISALQNAVFGVGVFFSSSYPPAFFFTVLINNALLVLNTILGLITVYSIFFPSYRYRWPLGFISLTGFFLIFYTFLIRSSLVAIFRNYNLYTTVDSLMSHLLFTFLFLSIGSFIFIFSQLFLRVNRRDTRIFSGILAIFGIAGLINVFIRFIVFPDINANNLGLEISTGLIGVGIIILIIVASHYRQRISGL